jgi:glucose/arabinose dehydrogenase
LAAPVFAVLLAACGAVQPSPTVRPTATVPSARTAAPSATASTSLEPTASANPTATVTATPVPPASVAPFTLGLEPYAGGFQALTFVTDAGDGSGLMYAVEQRGVIWPIAADGTVAQVPFLDITDRISTGGERGLLGLAFHPDYRTNGRFFVAYTNLAGDDVISEFTRSVRQEADPGSERILMTIHEPFANHNGGMVAFGSDGYLYIGLGDGGSGGDPFGNGQNGGVLLGKILRIDVDSGDPYGIPADNPFANGPNLPEIWDLGMRNPWRYSFDRATGDLWIGDVGQSAREEVDAEPAGQGGRNYGWNIMEGTICYDATSCDETGLTLPVYDYGRGNICAVTGGYVYRGTQFPQLAGQYVFSDYCSGTLWTMDAASTLATGQGHVMEVGQSGKAPSAFGEDEAGELYLVDHNGSIFKVVVR